MFLKNNITSPKGIKYELDKEVRTGDYWVDGSPIYCKVIRKSNLEIKNGTSIPHGIATFKDLIDLKTIVEDGTQSNWSILPRFDAGDTKSINATVNQTDVVYKGSDTWGAYPNRIINIIIKYTKSGGGN